MEEAKKAAFFAEKLKKASLMLFLGKPRKPGVKGSELKRELGKEWKEVIRALKAELGKIGLDIKILSNEGTTESLNNEEKLLNSRFFIASKEPVQSLKTLGRWKIDELALLAVVVAYIISKHGKAPKTEVKRILLTKFPRQMIELSLLKFIRLNYIAEEDGILRLDWRAKAEIDPDVLVRLVLGEQEQ